MARPIHRTHTRVLAVVHSHHHPGPINISYDILSLRSSKSIKAVGQLSLEVVPRKNYFNLVYPNDVINVYVDPGDGVSGFVRIFMGYIDKIERTEQTDDAGGVTTSFRIACSDFQKVFERTQIQVNNHIQHRRDLVEEDYTVAGTPTALMTSGVRAHGSPADLIENLSGMLLGFGKQWVLPTSYGIGSKVIADNRQRRAHRSKARLSDDVLGSLATLLGGLVQSVDATLLSYATYEDLEKQINVANSQNLGEGVETLNSPVEREVVIDGRTVKVKRGTLDPQAFAQLRAGREALRAYHIALKEVTSEVYTLLDLLDFSFIEASAIDGYIQDKAMWTEGGTLISLMKKFSHELINELVFDLRPVAVPGRASQEDYKYLDRCFGDQYSKDPDELGYNHGFMDEDEDGDGRNDTLSSSVNAVEYVPAIVFREYPFSTVEGVDLGNLAATFSNPLGFVPFGPIFSATGSGENSRYRALYNYNEIKEISEKRLAVAALGCNYGGPPLKHLDVVVVDDADVISATVGRSDNDTTNFFTMFAENSTGDVYKHIMNEFMPVTNPISIARNGLRAKEYTTRFANYGTIKDCVGRGDEGAPVKMQTLRNMVRWILLVDHWDQHNIEYLTGDISFHGLPELRVGYRLDWSSRRESYYVESVSHSWSFGKEMVTSAQVSRGQRNDPFLSYIPPKSTTLTTADKDRVEGGDRSRFGRLAEFFEVLNSPATSRSTQAVDLDTFNNTDSLGGNEQDKARNSGFRGFRGESIYAGNVVYAYGRRDVATNLVLPSSAKEAPAAPKSTEPPEPLPTEEVPKRVYKPAPRDFDTLFEKYSTHWPSYLPVPFLRALTKNESSFNPNETKGPAWGLMQVGIDGFPDAAYAPILTGAPVGKSGKVLLSWNTKGKPGGPYTPPDVLDPETNIKIATELLSRIVRVLESVGLGTFNWNSYDHVGILVASWNAGYSKSSGAARMVKWLVDNGHEVTLKNFYYMAAEARIAIAVEKYGESPTPEQFNLALTNQLSRHQKYDWWNKVVATYIDYKGKE